MSHASLGMQHQLLCQYCHGQCAFLTCMCFREDKESTCCWLWQVPSALVGLNAQSFHIVQFTYFQTTQWVPLRSGRLLYLCLWKIALLSLVRKDSISSGHVLQWSFAWPLSLLLSKGRFLCPNWYTLFSKRLKVVGPTFYSCLHFCEVAKWCRSLLLAVDLCLLSKFHSPTFSWFGTPRPSSILWVH